MWQIKSLNCAFPQLPITVTCLSLKPHYKWKDLYHFVSSLLLCSHFFHWHTLLQMTIEADGESRIFHVTWYFPMINAYVEICSEYYVFPRCKGYILYQVTSEFVCAIHTYKFRCVPGYIIELSRLSVCLQRGKEYVSTIYSLQSGYNQYHYIHIF